MLLNFLNLIKTVSLRLEMCHASPLLCLPVYTVVQDQIVLEYSAREHMPAHCCGGQRTPVVVYKGQCCYLDRPLSTPVRGYLDEDN